VGQAHIPSAPPNSGCSPRRVICSFSAEYRCWPMRQRLRLNDYRRIVLTSASYRTGTAKTYSITSSARARSVGDTVSPSALAVFKLSTVLYLVGDCTGRSAGFSPLKIRST